MKMKGIFAALAAMATTGALALLPSLPAEAAEDPAIATAKGFLSQYGASQTVQDRLIASYLAGEQWDSMSSAAEAVSVEKYTEADGDYTVNTYRDGSISVSRFEIPKVGDALNKPGISGCSVSGTSRNNCKVDMWVGLVSLSFYASYNLNNNTVTNTYGAGWSIGGACSANLVYLGRPASNIGRMDVSAQMCGIPYSTTFWLQLTVRSGSAAVSWSS
ncbi:hypothetical protein [Leifsonia sp. WHRI 6310E]|uniref:hypothetical protein n=1 Tax=Leifsonia sp. WHRI 6310E TaxID=3162562 RepID=UPI0032EB5A19